MEESCAEKMVRGTEDRVDVDREGSMQAEREMSVKRVEESTERPESDGDDMETEGASGGNKRVRIGPIFTGEQEMFIIDFVKDHPELYTPRKMLTMLTKPERKP